MRRSLDLPTGQVLPIENDFPLGPLLQRVYSHAPRSGSFFPSANKDQARTRLIVPEPTGNFVDTKGEQAVRRARGYLETFGLAAAQNDKRHDGGQDPQLDKQIAHCMS